MWLSFKARATGLSNHTLYQQLRAYTVSPAVAGAGKVACLIQSRLGDDGIPC